MPGWDALKMVKEDFYGMFWGRLSGMFLDDLETNTCWLVRMITSWISRYFRSSSYFRYHTIFRLQQIKLYFTFNQRQIKRFPNNYSNILMEQQLLCLIHYYQLVLFLLVLSNIQNICLLLLFIL